MNVQAGEAQPPYKATAREHGLVCCETLRYRICLSGSNGARDGESVARYDNCVSDMTATDSVRVAGALLIPERTRLSAGREETRKQCKSTLMVDQQKCLEGEHTPGKMGMKSAGNVSARLVCWAQNGDTPQQKASTPKAG